MDLLAVKMPDMTWTVNNLRDTDDTGTVYADNLSLQYQEGAVFTASYQVLLRSTDWGKAETYAHNTLSILDRRQNETLHPILYKKGAPYKRLTVDLLGLRNYGGVLFLGIGEDNTHEYSINFDARMHLIKEEEI